MNIGDFYAIHNSVGLDEADPRWLDVSRLLHTYARGTVTAHCHSLIGLEREQLTDAVQARLLAKFMNRRFQCADGQSFERLLNRSAKNDMIDELRGSRSISAESMDGRPIGDTIFARMRGESDVFAVLREVMRPYRFREFLYVRDCILSYFLQRKQYPPPSWLKSIGVPPDSWAPVFNAAVFDINSAILEAAA